MPTETDGINVAHALELQCMLLFRGWCYRLKEEHFVGNTITQALNNRAQQVQKEKWDWLVDHWADPKQQVFHDQSLFFILAYVNMNTIIIILQTININDA